MELRHLRTFLAIAEEGSITAASRRLFTSQPAVTRQLAQLERSLDTRLFDRLPQGVTLTDAGLRLAPEAGRILGLADAVIEGCRDDQSSLRGSLVISSPEEGLGPLTAVVIAAYRAAHPNVDVVVHEETPYESIETLGDRSNPYDIALWGLDFGDDRFHVDGVYSERIELLTSECSEIARADRPIPVSEALDLAYANPSDFMQKWAHRHMLAELRNGSHPRFATHEPFDHATECLDDVIARRAVVGVTTGTDPVPGTVQVPIDADVVATIGVITPVGEQRQHVRNFGTIAAAVGRDLYPLCPGARPPLTPDGRAVAPLPTDSGAA